MTSATIEEQVDEAATLGSLKTCITQRREAARSREVVDRHYREVSRCEADAEAATQEDAQLESQLKSIHKRFMLGTTKVGELAALKERMSAVKEKLAKAQLALEEQRSVYYLGQETFTQQLADLEKAQRELRVNLCQLYAQRFSKRDTGLLGQRGSVCWADPDPNSPERWRQQWRERAFHFLLHKGFSSDLTEVHCLAALIAFFREDKFQVRVRIGFVPTSTKKHEPLEVGQTLHVPGLLSCEEGFEELVRQRVQFVTES